MAYFEMLSFFSNYFRMILCGLNAPRLDFAKAPGMLDIGGFDATVPDIINKFITNQLDH